MKKYSTRTLLRELNKVSRYIKFAIKNEETLKYCQNVLARVADELKTLETIRNSLTFKVDMITSPTSNSIYELISCQHQNLTNNKKRKELTKRIINNFDVDTILRWIAEFDNDNLKFIDKEKRYDE